MVQFSLLLFFSFFCILQQQDINIRNIYIFTRNNFLFTLKQILFFFKENMTSFSHSLVFVLMMCQPQSSHSSGHKLEKKKEKKEI